MNYDLRITICDLSPLKLERSVFAFSTPISGLLYPLFIFACSTPANYLVPLPTSLCLSP